MFHYRQESSSNLSRLLIAVFLAIALHIGLMNFEFIPKPILIPTVSLPRSVSIFLQQNSIVQTQDQPVKKTQEVIPIKEEQLTVKKEQNLPVPQEHSTVIDKPVSSFKKAPSLLKKTVKQHFKIAPDKNETVVEEIVPEYRAEEITTGDSKPETRVTATFQEFNTQEEGVLLPGTIQMAYPRYQVNEPPTYPVLARKRGQEGSVILQVQVNKEGRVEDLKIDIASDFAILDRAAIAAVRKWSFEPGRRGKERVTMWVRVPVTFKLKK